MTGASPFRAWRLSGNTWMQRVIANYGMEMAETMKMPNWRISTITAEGFYLASFY
jgi:hypothetical protein